MKNIGIYYLESFKKSYIFFEIKKWKKVFKELGFNTIDYSISERLFFEDIKNKEIIREEILGFLKNENIDLLILEDLCSIPHFTYLSEAIHKSSVKLLIHHHNLPTKGFYKCKKLKELYASHVVLNSIDQDKLFKGQGIRARVVPYMYDPDEIRPFKRNWKYLTLFMPDIPHMREGIAIVIKNKLENILGEKVELIKSASLEDLLSSDIMIYPTFFQGWAPYLMEAIAGGVPALISDYKVYKRDISPFEFDFISLGNMESEDIEKAINRLVNVMLDERVKNKMISRNREIAERCFSLSMLKRYIKAIVDEF